MSHVNIDIIRSTGMSFYPAPVQRLFDAFRQEGHDLYLVGGAVRDYELGAELEKLDDLDFCTDARAEESLEILKRYDFTFYKLGMEFGTVGAILHNDEHPELYPKDCQITTYRSDEYYRRGSRHPEVNFGDTIEQDLSRRDFSINSMALDGFGQIVDPYDGKHDLEREILRVIGDPLETLAEDPLRILRTARFMSKLGFDPTGSLEDASYKQADHILEISHERWYQEMTKLLQGGHTKKALQFLHETRLLGIILPEVDALAHFERWKEVDRQDQRTFKGWSKTIQTLERVPRSAAVGWASLCYNIGRVWTRRKHPDGTVDYPRHEAQSCMLFKDIARRFKFDNNTEQCVLHLLRNQDILPDKRPGELDEVDARRFVSKADPHIAEIFHFERAKNQKAPKRPDKKEPDLIKELTEIINRLEDAGQLRPELPTGFGNSVMDTFDLEPSPLIGEVKDWLHSEMIEGRLEIGLDEETYLDYIADNPPEFLRRQLNQEAE